MFPSRSIVPRRRFASSSLIERDFCNSCSSASVFTDPEGDSFSSLLKTSSPRLKLDILLEDFPISTPKSPLVLEAVSTRTVFIISSINRMAASASSTKTSSRRRSLALAVASRMRDSKVRGVAGIWFSLALFLSLR